MIEVKNKRKALAIKLLIEDISGVMDTGKCNLIIGSSGSGKTVFTKCIVGLFKPDHGEISYDGKNMLEMDREERTALRQQIGMLFQGLLCSIQ
jgi:phospholipid/cholesterol/gamma-HCH transport system ATP-binding protein